LTKTQLDLNLKQIAVYKKTLKKAKNTLQELQNVILDKQRTLLKESQNGKDFVKPKATQLLNEYEALLFELAAHQVEEFSVRKKLQHDLGFPLVDLQNKIPASISFRLPNRPRVLFSLLGLACVTQVFAVSIPKSIGETAKSMKTKNNEF